MSSYLQTVKIDPLRGHCQGQETPEEGAVRELYEESRGLFDLRHFETCDIAKLPRTFTGDSWIFHLKVEFEAMSPEDKITPSSLIQKYRNNRRVLQGCEEVLDLAVEPMSRIESPQHYPRLSSQTIKILPNRNFPMNEVPSIRLYEKNIAGMTTYSVDSWKGGLDIPSLQPKLERHRYHHLLLDGPQWERWIVDHDRIRAAKSKFQCLVSSKESDSSYEFIDKGPRPSSMSYRDQVNVIL